MCAKRFSLGMVFALLGVLVLPLPLFAFTGDIAEGAPIKMGDGEQQVLSFPERLSKVAISDPEVAGVTVSDDREILLTANAEGSAELSVWLHGRSEPLRALVVVAATLGQKLPFGTQVQTDIRIVEVNRSELNSLGVYYSKLFNGGASAVGVAPPGSNFRGFPGPGVASAPISADGFNLFGFGPSSLAIINALESGGFAHTLAEPSLVSLSGQNATFLSGGEFPIPVSNDENGVRVEYKEFGISLSLTPTVVDENQIILKVAPEVSELDFSTGVASAGVAVPGLRVRRTETTVAMGSGETFIISGLVSRNTFNSSDRIPGLGSIPLLGAFFRSDRVSREDRELIMVVTPRLVSPSRQDSSLLTIGKEYQHSSTRWLDMATGSEPGSRPIKHGLSW